MCIYEQRLLKKIHWKELADLNWINGKNPNAISQIISHFNKMSDWITSEIISGLNVDARARSIEKFIRIAEVERKTKKNKKKKEKNKEKKEIMLFS